MWSRSAPTVLRHVQFNASGTSFAASAERDSRLIVWHLRKKQSEAPTPTWGGLLPHPSPVLAFNWRDPPTATSQSDVIVSRSQDGTSRVWAPVIDEPTKLRLSATIDRHSFGKAGSEQNPGLYAQVLYLDAAALATSVAANVSLLERDLQLAEINLGDGANAKSDAAQRAQDQKRTRLKRLQHLTSDTPDMFLTLQDDGTLVMRAVAHIDRRPPTLLQAFTVLKMPAPICLGLANNLIVHAHLIPLETPIGGSSDAPLAILHLQNDRGASFSLGLNPSLFFDGQNSGLTAMDIGMLSRRPSMTKQVLKVCSTSGSSATIDALGEITEWRVRHRRQLENTSGSSKRHLLQGRSRGSICQRTIIAMSDQATLSQTIDGKQLIFEGRSSTEPIVLTGLNDEETALCAILAHESITVLSSQRRLVSWNVNELARGQHPNLVQSLDITSVQQAIFQDDGRTLAILAQDGTLTLWKAEFNTEAPDAWSLSNSLETGAAEATLLAASRTGIVALTRPVKGTPHVDIWDTSEAEFASALQMSLPLIDQEIVALHWFSNDHSGEMLAVATRTSVKIFSRARPPVLLTRSGIGAQQWHVLAELNLQTLTTKPIAGLSWTPEGAVIVSVGSCTHLLGPLIATAASDQRTSLGHTSHILEAAAQERSPLPAYHPSVLLQCMLWAKWSIARRVTQQLWQMVQHAERTEDIELGDMDDLTVDELLSSDSASRKHSTRQAAHSSLFEDADGEASDDRKDAALSASDADRLCDKLVELQTLPCLIPADVEQLINLVKCLSEVTRQDRSLDDNGHRYLLSLRSFMHAKKRLLEESQAGDLSPFDAPRLRHRDFAWALHSTCQETLLSTVIEAHQGKLPWAAARSVGVFMWLISPAALVALTEQVARDQFMSGGDRDPVGCSIFYYALGRNKLVLNLWRQAAWHPEQQKMLRFLANDFEMQRWKDAALKNAFALLSQRRFLFAASFFLLGDSLHDAVNVCIRNLEDIHLAIAICRIKEQRDDGPVLTNLIKTKVLPMVRQKSLRWLGHWCFWVLGRRDKATKILISPLDDIFRDPSVQSLLPASLQVPHLPIAPMPRSEDVALAIFFSDLKHKSLQTIKGSQEISPREEWGFVLYMNRILRRMGCHVVGLTLLAAWDFDVPDVSHLQSNNEPIARPEPHTEAHHAQAKPAHKEGGRAEDLFDALNDRPPSPSLPARQVQPRRLSATHRRHSSLSSASALPTAVPSSPPATSPTERHPPPLSPTLSSHPRRRSSLMRRRSSVIDDLDLVRNFSADTAHNGDVDGNRYSSVIHEGIEDGGARVDGQSGRPKQSSGDERANLPEQKPAAADKPKEQEKRSEEAEKKPKQAGLLFKGSSNASQQGAQEFDMGNFGF
ncbi:unnamed protein product [Jaminaea pallidilutea]